jgi:hypothetical protein
MMPPDRISKIKARAKRNALLATKAAKPLLPEDAEPHYIIALANEMLQQASTVYEPDWRSNGPEINNRKTNAERLDHIFHARVNEAMAEKVEVCQCG